MVAYCGTTLQGLTCVDSRCQYSHDVIHCKPCGRSFPASLFPQHQNAQQHLRNVASNGPPNPSTSRSLSQSPLSDLLSAPSSNPSRPSGSNTVNTPTIDEGPRVTVSDEGGLDFVAEGTGTADNPSFPSVSHTILIEKTNVLSSLTVHHMSLTPSPNPCFIASLLGKSLEVRKKTVRKIEVLFKAPRGGDFQGALKITFRDKTRSDEEFTVTRELRGRAVPPDGPASSGELSNTAEAGTVKSERAGITVSHDLGLEFSVERSRLDEPFAMQTEELVITKSLATPLVYFKAVKVCSSDDSVASWFSARFEGDSKWIKYNRHRKVTVCFTPQREGAVIELTLCDHTHKTDFVIKRILTGRAKQPAGGGHLQIEYAPDTGPQPVDDQVDDHARIPVDEELLDSDGTGISVSHADGLDFGVVERMDRKGPFATSSSLLTIKHGDDFPAVTFKMGRTKTSNGSDRDFEAVFEGDSHNIQPGTQSTVRVVFSPKFEGLFKATLELVFYHTQVSVWFVIRRKLQGIAGSLEDHKHFELLGQENGLQDDSRTSKNRAASPQETLLLLSPDRRRRSRYFPGYEVPPMIQEAVDESSDAHPYDENAPNLISALVPRSFNMGTYAHYFYSLLAIEDGHQQWDIRSQPTYEVDVQGRGPQYSIYIENNDEDYLPEVALGDFLWLDGILDDMRIEARVTNVDVFTRRHLAVLKMSLKLPTDFNLHKGSKFDLRFRHNRVTLRRQYRALTTTLALPRRLLFPSVLDSKPIRSLSRVDIDNLKFRQLVNKDIRDDKQQLQAVISILEQPQGSIPFILCGPPGTGKTSTIVESIVQLVRRDAGVRVLVCAPSNTAADLLAERLAAAGLDLDKMYRLDASSRCEEDTFEDVRTPSLYPGLERLLAFRVVLSTCSSAAVLQDLDVPVGHFSYIVIDEAAQAEEPLAMIPIMGFSNAHTIIILAGDPNQLAPTIKSPTAARAGLGTSYLERLMLMREVYGLDTQAGKSIVALHRNRRSHGNIIAWSNRYLYEDIIRDYGNAYITYHLVLSDVLPNKGFPIVFHGVKGSEHHTKWSPSYFNIIEASIVRDYCVKLTGDPERNIYPEEIGIVTPYKAQSRAIRELLKVAKLSDILVGSVEQFQGQERKVIILATTRSNEESDPVNGSGFLMNRHRMNVAITRAQALLIVIGDPEVLGKDELWRTFLNYVKSRKGWTGKMHSWKTEEAVYLPGYEVVPREGGVVHGEEFIGGKSEMICVPGEVWQ